MPALEIRQDEIGNVGFDLAAYKARRARLMGANPPPPKPAMVRVVHIIPPRKTMARVLYPAPIGPIRIRDILAVASPAESSPKLSRRILQEVCQLYGVNMIDLISDRRTANLVRPRMHCYYRLRTETTLSYPQIGRLMGGRDHTTAMHGYKKFLAQVEAGKVVVELPPSLAAE